MTCPCGRPLDMGVDHGDTETGDPICKACCPDCNPKGPQVNEPVHKITYPVTSRLSRKDIELRVANPHGYDSAFIEACRQWLADHPAPLTREQLDRLPPGTVIGTTRESTHVRTGTGWLALGGNGMFPDEATKIWARPQGVFVPLTVEEIREWTHVLTYGLADHITKVSKACQEATA